MAGKRDRRAGEGWAAEEVRGMLLHHRRDDQRCRTISLRETKLVWSTVRCKGWEVLVRLPH